MKYRFYYDADTREIIDTAVSLDLLSVYARVPYHENGELIARLLNENANGNSRPAPHYAKAPAPSPNGLEVK